MQKKDLQLAQLLNMQIRVLEYEYLSPVSHYNQSKKWQDCTRLPKQLQLRLMQLTTEVGSFGEPVC
jgi:hypothetical protein